jgi:hypothetical protein
MGASDGEPRRHIDPWDQIEDYSNPTALDLAARPAARWYVQTPAHPA